MARMVLSYFRCRVLSSGVPDCDDATAMGEVEKRRESELGQEMLGRADKEVLAEALLLPLSGTCKANASLIRSGQQTLKETEQH